MDGMTRRDAVQRVMALMGGLALVGRRPLEAFAFDAAAMDQAMAEGVGRVHRRRRRPARRDRRDHPARDHDARRQGGQDRRLHGADGHRRLHRRQSAGVPRRHAGARGGLPGRDQRLVHAGHAGPAPDAARGPRPRAEDGDGGAGQCRRARAIPGRGAARRGRAAALLPADEGTGAARLLHLRDRLHQGDALRRVAGALRSRTPRTRPAIGPGRRTPDSVRRTK